MGLIKAAIGAAGGVLADQWKEYFYCDALGGDVLACKGSKRTSRRSSNTKGFDNIISSGSVIAVADGQCMMIVEQGKVVEVCAEPGEFIYDAATEPSIFSGSLGEGIGNIFRQIGKRFTFGGEAPMDQRVYYFNTKEILDNKFGTPTPVMFEVVNHHLNMRRTVNLRFNGIFTYTISNPLLFYTRLCGNMGSEYRRENIDGQLRADFMDALQPAVSALSELELRPAQIPGKTRELKAAMNTELAGEWGARGITIQNIAMNPITMTEADMKKIQEMEDAATYGSNARMMAGRMTDATASAMETAAGNTAGAMTGFMGMGMASQSGFGAAQNMYALGQQEPPRIVPEPRAAGWTCSCGSVNTGKFCTECGAGRPADNSWKCACGSVNKGRFCPECGAKKPAGALQYRCDKCGWEPEKGAKPPRFCPECGDPFDNGDII